MKTCIFTVIKDELDYLNDFIRYHINLGIDTLFIFEDIGSQSHKFITDQYPQVVLHSILDLFEDKEDIIKRKNSGEFVQKDYIKQGLLWIRDNFDYDWCFAIDCDEYITPIEPFPSLLTAFQDYDGILLYWKNYGCSGHLKKPLYDKPITSIYTQECGYTNDDWKRRNITKMCFNMKRLEERFICGNHVALCNWVRTDFGIRRTDPPCFEKLYIRHYITKSWEEYAWKLKKRGMMCKVHRGYDDFFEMQPELLANKDELINGLSL